MKAEKRLIVYMFPALYGTGWGTDSLVLGVLFAAFRFFRHPLSEIVLRDTQTDEFILRF